MLTPPETSFINGNSVYIVRLLSFNLNISYRTRYVVMLEGGSECVSSCWCLNHSMFKSLIITLSFINTFNDHFISFCSQVCTVPEVVISMWLQLKSSRFNTLISIYDFHVVHSFIFLYFYHCYLWQYYLIHDIVLLVWLNKCWCKHIKIYI